MYAFKLFCSKHSVRMTFQICHKIITKFKSDKNYKELAVSHLRIEVLARAQKKKAPIEFYIQA